MKPPMQARAHALLWPRSRRGLTAGAVAVVLVILTLAGWLWFQSSMQTQEQDRELAHAAGDARRKSTELREAAKTLEPVMDQARRVRDEATGTLGATAPEVAALTDALRVAELMVARVDDLSSRGVSDTLAAAAAALPEYQDQLALVEPVRTNLTEAIADAEKAMDGKRLGEALEEFRTVDAAMTRAMEEARVVVGALEQVVDGLVAPVSPPPEPTSTGTAPAGAGEVEQNLDEEESAEADEAAEAAEVLATQIDQLNATITAVNAELLRAEDLAAALLDRSDVGAVRLATHARAAELTRLQDVTNRARELHADLLAAQSESADGGESEPSDAAAAEGAAQAG
ncbi:MAG: hypothetical protein LBK72_02490 [Bifidobacteriaceae bacterium]|jgi:uncharacterized phage infection (PIP) family protein YhgE|nr:hypothetical protein [Bifidobacteriaceae bacterium]